MHTINLQSPITNLKVFLKNSIDDFGTLQKLENQIQGLLLGELLQTNVFPIPLLEWKTKNGKSDILFDGERIELKHQYEFDIAQLHNYTHHGGYQKLGKAIDNDIKKSNIFMMFILERKQGYSFNKDFFYFPKFHNNTTWNFHNDLSQYMNKLMLQFPNKYVSSTNYVQGNNWDLHILLVCDKALQNDIIL